jgi:hypothetical protein
MAPVGERWNLRAVARSALRSTSGWLLALAIVGVAIARPTTASADTPKRIADPDEDLDVRDLDRDASPASSAGNQPDPDADEFSTTRCPVVPGTTCGERGVPPIDDVIGAAYAAAGLANDPARSWIRRGRLAALVPWITVRAGRDVNWQDNDPDVGRSQTYEVRATWRLDRLAFDARELQVASIESARRREKRRLAARVVRVYFTWLRAHRAALREPRWALHAAESAAELDALTNGEFTRAVRTARPGHREPDRGSRTPG